MTRLMSLVIVAGFWMCASGGALAQTPAAAAPEVDPAFAERFLRADKNQDGGLSPEEAGQARFQFKEDFNVIDRDQNGVVTLYEIGETMARYMSGWSAADLDGDGVVSEEEAERAKSSMTGVFMRADRDRDQRVTREEYDTYTRRQLYDHVEMPYVAPNIIEKKF